MNHWEAYKYGDGIVTIQREEISGLYYIKIDSGIMHGTMVLSDDELRKLKSFAKSIKLETV